MFVARLNRLLFVAALMCLAHGCAVGEDLPRADASRHSDDANDAANPADVAPQTDTVPASQDGLSSTDTGTSNDAIAINDSTTVDVPASCTGAATRCGDNNAVEQCRAGAWTVVQTCAFACIAGACTNVAACAPGATQCDGNAVATCSTDGTRWVTGASCASVCMDGHCALDALDITHTTTLDGEVWVAGAIVVHTGSALNSPTGDLTLHADSIVVESGASITVAATGHTAAGAGQNGTDYWSPNAGTGYEYGRGGGGGGYGTPGSDGHCIYSNCADQGRGGVSFGSLSDAIVTAGAQGGFGGPTESGGTDRVGGAGGGVLRLIATTEIRIDGTIAANGAAGTPWESRGEGIAAGGGSGGGILLAADHITLQGTVSAVGGAGGAGVLGNSTAAGGDGGNGRVKILYGSGGAPASSNVRGAITLSVAPPMTLASPTHPNPALFYNDDFTTTTVHWNPPIASARGYYWAIGGPFGVPSPASSDLLVTNTVAVPRAMLHSGTNYFQIVAVDSNANVGTVANAFPIQINAAPPTVSSMSHPNPSTWYASTHPFMAWTLPNGVANYRGVHYVLDHEGDTVPTSAATFVPISTATALLDATPGIWVFHVVSEDTQGHLTRSAAHFPLLVGADPGNGVLVGHVVDSAGHDVAGCTIRMNRGVLPDQSSNASGTFSFDPVPAGTWELTASKDGFQSQTQSIVVTASQTARATLTLTGL